MQLNGALPKISLEQNAINMPLNKLPVQSNNIVSVASWDSQLKVTDVCVEVGVEPGVDVAVQVLVIPDVPPTPSHPWS